MWTDDRDFVESCDFYRSLLNFDSIDSIGAFAATNTFAYVKAPNVGEEGRQSNVEIRTMVHRNARSMTPISLSLEAILVNRKFERGSWNMKESRKANIWD